MEIKHAAQENFITSMDFESNENNFKYDFKTMTKKYGNAFIACMQAAWEANVTQTEDEFCKMNANMPNGFFNNVIKR